MRIIAHIDMDAFFAAVEERDNPQFRGLPIAIGADPMKGRGRGVVSTANYKAREYGIHSAMPITKAWHLSEKAKKEGKAAVIFMEVDFEKYGRISEEIFKMVRKYSDTVEVASIDEAYFDISYAGSFSRARDICEKIKKEIKKKENLTASVGIGSNKLIAKIASGFKKPDGLTVVTDDGAEKFLEPLSVREVPGIGPKTEQVLNDHKIFRIKDLKKISKDDLESMFGKWGADIYERARGRDDSPLIEEHEVKSMGEQETFLEDTKDFNLILKSIFSLCDDVAGKLEESEFKGFRTVVLTVRFSGFETKNRSHTLKKSASSASALKNEVLKLLMPFFDKRENPKGKSFRLIGVRIEKLE